jgi:WS/DGAT/MGAT family acyltransferase
MERLNGDDTRILRLESEAIAGHTMKVAITEPAPGGRPVTVGRLRARVEARLDSLPRARERLAPTPLGIATPAWIDDDDFEIAAHVRPAPEPLTDRSGLVRFAGRAMAERLDHAKPLWCVDVMGPDVEGRTALVVRIHHCLADGVTALRILSALLWDDDSGDQPGGAAPWSPRPAPGSARLLAAGAASRLGDLRSAAVGGARAAISPARWRRAGREMAALPATLRRELWPLGADTAFDRSIGADREVAFTDCRIEDLKRVERAAGPGVTVNDVVLAMIAGAIRGWLETHDQPIEAMRVQIPVSMHHRDEGAKQLGNRDSFLFCDLPIAEPDPSRRLEAINAETRTRKERHDPAELYSFFHTLSHIRPLDRYTSELSSGPREFALSVSNVPGPRQPVRVLGAEVTELYSVAEPAERHALRASAVSLAGRMGFGFCTDPGAVPGVTELATGLDTSLEELISLC